MFCTWSGLGVFGGSVLGGLFCLHCSLPPGTDSVWLKPSPSWRAAKNFARRNKWATFSGGGRRRTDHRTRTKGREAGAAALITPCSAGAAPSTSVFAHTLPDSIEMKQWVEFSAVTWMFRMWWGGCNSGDIFWTVTMLNTPCLDNEQQWTVIMWFCVSFLPFTQKQNPSPMHSLDRQGHFQPCHWRFLCLSSGTTSQSQCELPPLLLQRSIIARLPVKGWLIINCDKRLQWFGCFLVSLINRKTSWEASLGSEDPCFLLRV